MDAPEDRHEANSYQICTHCGKLLHRSTAIRHQAKAARENALAAALNYPPIVQPPPSSPTDSITSTERALSPLHASELGSMDMDMESPPAGPNTPDLPPIDNIPFPDIDMDGAADDVGLPAVEEPDPDLLRAIAPPPPLPTPEQIYERARYGILEEEEDENEAPGVAIPPGVDNFIVDWPFEDDMQIEDYELPPTVELEAEAELNAARMRLVDSIPEDSPEWMALKTFKLQMEVNLGHNAYQKLRCTFDELDLPSLQVLRSKVQALSSISLVKYHCCPNSCICYVGAYANRQQCHHCNAPRFKPDGTPAKLFHYLPIIPQIKALYAGRASASRMRYRSEHHDDNIDDENGTIDDVYDSELYKRLRESYAIVHGRVQPFKYFQDPRDVFLTGMTDGFQVFKKGKHTAWPLIYINNNLSPAERYKLGNIICVGLIPGPRKPKEHDSFMYVVVEDLAKAALGTAAYDAYDDCMFTLRIFGPLKCGDIPAMASAYTGGKHHGAEHPCRACPIQGIRITGTNNLSHYLPLQRPPDYPPQPYSLATLPLRTHSEYLRQAKEVDDAPTQTERKRLSQLYGINHTPITAMIPGITFPFSFPYEFMHLLEGSIKNYVELFCNAFKSLGDGVESFVITDSVWKEIGALTVKANATMPASFGRRIPNIAEDRTYMTAEGYMVWATMYAPILLRGRFRQERYYLHWIKFVSIIERCVQLSSTALQRQELRALIHEWYTEYERIFYQYSPERLPACVLVFHAWIHLVDMIENSGPLWAYWTWAMERYCGLLSRAVSSRKHPYSSLNRRILEIQTLHSIRNMYDLDERLPIYTTMYASEPPPSYYDPVNYPDLTLLHPQSTISFARDGLLDLRRRIAIHLATRYKVNVATASQAILPSVIQWGRVRIEDSDVVYSNLGYSRKEENRRDATFIQYELLVDIHARRRAVEPEFEPRTFFGRLDRVFICEVQANEAMCIAEPVSLLLMDVKTCNVARDPYGFFEYTTYGSSEVVDGSSLRALVGRIMDRGKWVFVRRTGVVEHAEFDEDDD